MPLQTQFITNETLLGFVRNNGNPELSMIAMVSGSLANIVLDYIFIFPCGLGIFGAVLATGFSPLFSLLILSTLKIRKLNQFHFIKIKPDLIGSRSILSLGFPSLVTEVASGIVMIVFNMILLNLGGNIGVAAYGVIANLVLVTIAIYTGVAQGMQPLISRAYGNGNLKNTRQILHYGLCTITVLSILIYAEIYFFASPITAVFNSEQNADLQKIAELGLRLYFTGILFAGCNIMLSIYFTSTEKPLPAHVISLFRGLIFIIPLAFLLSVLWGITGVWIAFPATEFLVMILGICIYRKLCSSCT